MRYSEELARLRMYTLAQREHELDRAECDFKFVLDILRNEKPVYFDRAAKVIKTGFEPVGEGEI